MVFVPYDEIYGGLHSAIISAVLYGTIEVGTVFGGFCCDFSDVMNVLRSIFITWISCCDLH